MAFSLAGLGAVAGGVGKGLEFGEDLQSKQLQRQAQDALGRAFMGGEGLGGLGGLNQGSGPQPPSPGQASQPMQQPANQNFGSPSMGAPQAPQGGAPMPGQATPQMMQATSSQESGGNYQTIGQKVTDKSGNTGNALGKYGIMSYNVPQWTKEVLGQSLTPAQFLGSPQAQDAVYKAKMGSYVQQYGAEGAGRAWLGGPGSVNNPGAKDALGTSVGSYGQQFAQGAGAQPGQGQPQPQQNQGSQGGAQPGQQASTTPQLTQLAQRIKASNPNIKPGVLWQAMAQAAPLMDKESQMAFQQQTALFNEQLKMQSQQISVLQKQLEDTLKQSTLEERRRHDAATEAGTPKNNVRYGVIGKDQNGQDQYGWIDPSKQTVTPGAPQQGSQPIPSPSDATGEEFLKTVDPQIRGTVKAIADGRMQISPYALSRPAYQKIMEAVTQYDPTFDATKSAARVSMRRDASSGTIAKTNNALNTAVGHLKQLADVVPQLGNSSFTPYNTFKNTASTLTGGTGQTNFNAVRNRVAQEVTRLWRGTGGNKADIDRDIQNISSSNTPNQLYQSIGNISDLIESKLQANEQQYEQVMGKPPDRSFLTPQTRAVLDALRSLAAPGGEQPTIRPAATNNVRGKRNEDAPPNDGWTDVGGGVRIRQVN